MDNSPWTQPEHSRKNSWMLFYIRRGGSPKHPAVFPWSPDGKNRMTGSGKRSHRCLGKTIDGSRCKRQLRGRKYCFSHISQRERDETIKNNQDEDVESTSTTPENENPSTDNPDCCICLEGDRVLYELESCGHRMHTECLLQLRKLKCPLCRVPIQDRSIKGQWKQKEGPDYEEIPFERSQSVNIVVPGSFLEMLIMAELVYNFVIEG